MGIGPEVVLGGEDDAMIAATLRVVVRGHDPLRLNLDALAVVTALVTVWATLIRLAAH